VDEEKYSDLRNVPGVEEVVCPGCRRIEAHVYEGEVLLESPLLISRKNEAVNLIHSTEEEARLDNPISRVASIEVRDGVIYVLTTTRWLAERIGKEFAKALGGHLTIDKPPREKFVRVHWIRDRQGE
jgi:hypothetical protein